MAREQLDSGESEKIDVSFASLISYISLVFCLCYYCMLYLSYIQFVL
jgi:hypothetical protein